MKRYEHLFNTRVCRQKLQIFFSISSMRLSYIDKTPVGQAVREMEDIFRRAVPEAKPDTIDLFIRRQLINKHHLCWHLRLKEADFENINQMVAKIQTLQLASESEARDSTSIAKTKRVSHDAKPPHKADQDSVTCTKRTLQGHAPSSRNLG